MACHLLYGSRVPSSVSIALRANQPPISMLFADGTPLSNNRRHGYINAAVCMTPALRVLKRPKMDSRKVFERNEVRSRVSFRRAELKSLQSEHSNHIGIHGHKPAAL